MLNKNSDLDGAISNYLISIELNERQAKAYFELGRIYIKLEKYDEALTLIERGYQINADYYGFYYIEGLLYKYVKNEKKHGNELLEKYHRSVYSLRGFFDSEHLSKDEKLRKQQLNFAITDIKNNAFLIEPYLALMRISSNYPEYGISIKEIYDKLIIQYPFLKNEKEILALLSKSP